MEQICEKNLCSGCGACSAICPLGSISMKEDAEGFLNPIIDNTTCINCNKCVNTCPVNNLHKMKRSDYPPAYICLSADQNIRKTSASGGAFSAIAKWFIIEKHGVVFGAAYDEDFNVNHVGIESVDRLSELQKSKYVQSDTKETYRETGNLLRSGKPVLYSGTPCQIYGLRNYLHNTGISDKDLIHLLCIDISCKGVPSPKLQRKYLAFKKAEHSSEVVSYNNREKTFFKSSYSINYHILFSNGDEYNNGAHIDPYGRCYFGEMASRMACYNCPYKTIWRMSDLTIGDCWFAKQCVPDLVDRDGVNVMFAQSEKGREIIEKCKNLISYPVDSEMAVKINGGMIYQSAQMNKNRNDFYSDMDQLSFEKLIDKYCPIPKLSFAKRIKKCARYILRDTPIIEIENKINFRKRILRSINSEAKAINLLF